MSQLTKERSMKLFHKLQDFQKEVCRQKPDLRKNATLQFTIQLNKKSKWICQCLNITKEIEEELCKTSTTLLKRLVYLRSKNKLSFAQDEESTAIFHLSLLNKTQRKGNNLGQLFLF